MAVVCFSKSLQLLNVTLFKSAGVIRGSVCRCPAIHRTVNSTLPHTQRALHTSQSVLVTKILSVDEIFSKKSLHDYLRKKEMEYNTWLDSISTENQPLDDENIKMKRTNLSALGPLVQKIKELEGKQKELEETQDLLKGNELKDVLKLKSFLGCHFICICISFQTMTQNYMSLQSLRRKPVWQPFKISNKR